MQPRQTSHKAEAQSSKGKRNLAGKARLPGKKPKVSPVTTQGISIEEVASSVSELILPELRQTIKSIITERQDATLTSAQPQNEASPEQNGFSTSTVPVAAGDVSDQQIDVVINPKQPVAKEGTDLVPLSLESSNLVSCLELNNAITSVDDDLGMHVPQSTKQKIVKGEFIELHSLLDRHPVNDQENKLVLNNGQLSVKPVSQIKILDIQTWLDAFFIFMSIYLAAHSKQAQQLLKYMANVKAAASRSTGFGWREYDRQFRVKKARNACIPWNKIDQELWLLYVNSSSVPRQNTLQQKACFDFNNKGFCVRPYCQYSHSCLKCTGKHPATKCQETNQNSNKPPVSNNEKNSYLFRRFWKKPQSSNYQKTRNNTY